MFAKRYLTHKLFESFLCLENQADTWAILSNSSSLVVDCLVFLHKSYDTPDTVYTWDDVANSALRLGKLNAICVDIVSIQPLTALEFLNIQGKNLYRRFRLLSRNAILRPKLRPPLEIEDNFYNKVKSVIRMWIYIFYYWPTTASLKASSLPILLSSKSIGFSWLKYVETVSTLGLLPLFVLLESASKTVSHVLLFCEAWIVLVSALLWWSMACLLLNILKLLKMTRAIFDEPFSPFLFWCKQKG